MQSRTERSTQVFKSMGHRDLICLNAGLMTRFQNGKGKSHLFGLPHFQHWHSSDDGVGVFLSGRVHRVVGSDDQHQVGI